MFLVLATIQGCAVATDSPAPAPSSDQDPNEAPIKAPNLRGLHGDYCTAETDTCTYGRPVPQAQLDAHEIVCPTVDAIMADPTTVVVCDE
jgi:hypothetical protein